MKKIYYKKLIRDKILTIIEKTGGDYEFRRLRSKEFEKELIKKILEEASEVSNAKNRRELISELADVLDVINKLMEIKKITGKDIKNAQDKSFKKKGGFEDQLFLEWTTDTGYEANKNKK